MYYEPFTPSIDSFHQEDGCSLCHEEHKEEGKLNEACKFCQDEKCPKCEGKIWLKDKDGEYECTNCVGGRVFEVGGVW